MKTKERFVGFDVLKRNVSMEQVLDRYGLLPQLHKSGDSFRGACPIHNGHNKSQFRVSISRNCWICFGDCHMGGSIVDFVSRKEGIDIREAALLIQDWFSLQPNQQPPKNSAPARQLENRPSFNRPLHFTLRQLDKTHPYLAERGLTAETIETFGTGYCTHGVLNGWIAIPIHSITGQILAYAGRWPGTPPDEQPKYKLPRGFRKSLELFNLHRAKKADASSPLIVVEGFFGCMKLWQAGYHRVVSTMGSMLSPTQEELITKTVGPNGTVILLFDEDEAGCKGRAEARRRLSENVKVRVVSFAEKGTQPDQLTSEQLNQLLGFSPS